MLEQFLHLFTVSGALALLNIIIIDIVMSWDNAIIIWMATKSLDEKYRKKAIMIWIVLATIMRIIFAFFAVYLLQIVWLKLAWGLLLLFVVWKFYKDLRVGASDHSIKTKSAKSAYLAAIYTIVLADVSMSLDNVLAVAWASHGNMVTLWIWLIFSIMLMAFASNLIASKLEKYPQIQWVWLLVILFVAIEMILWWTSEIWTKITFWNLMPILIFIIWILFVFVHNKYIKWIEKQKIRSFFENNYLTIIIFNLVLFILMIFFGDVISIFIKSHPVWLYSSLFIILTIFLELIAVFKTSPKR